MHIAGNLYIIVALGSTLEKEIGLNIYIIFFIFSSLTGNILSNDKYESNAISVGASTAGFGIMSLYVFVLLVT